MSNTPGDAETLRRAALELVHAAQTFLDAAERALSDEDTVNEWAGQGREMVHAFLAGFTGGGPQTGGDDIEHIPVD